MSGTCITGAFVPSEPKRKHLFQLFRVAYDIHDLRLHFLIYT